ncbi:metallophosphoesterase [Pseudomonas sp.]|uniref:metallophosphoesterase family protein n=1 Tax=Pseudomonas sp. TaxID=306 RepID=UPI0028B024A7|nr:metallophosphoesterase [Pseudomonas sp.]
MFYKKLVGACSLLLSLLAVNAYGQDSEYSPKHLIFTSDPQLPWTESSDRGWNETSGERDKRSRWLIESQYSDVANFRRNFHQYVERIPVMINGDMTAFGHGSERSTVKEILDRQLGGVYDYGLGNHDYQNNINDCSFPENNCAAGSISDLKDRYWGKIDSFDLALRDEGGRKTFYGSLAYSKNYGDVHLVQLNNEPTYSVRFSSGFPLFKVDYEIPDALDWLEKDLKVAREKGQIIILNMHKPDRWAGTSEQVDRFRAMIEKYAVTAVFAGHLHNSPGGYYRNSDSFGSVPVYLSGGASNQTYLITEFAADRKTMNVHQVNANNWPSRKLIATVDVRKE